ncbi:sn-glycerol-3-phosphate ABC transporter substrate-binding protein UgpB [soil metagenome]
MTFRIFALIGAVSALALASPAYAVTEIQWWHAMTGANNDVVVKLSEEFNSAQGDYKVVPSYKGSYPDTLNAGIAAFRAGNAPHIMQVFEVGTATMMSAKGAIKPVQELMKEAGESFDPNSYLPAITGYYSTASGEMLSFPFNSSTMVMWVNKDALKGAGLDPDAPPKTWPEVFEAAKKLKATTNPNCGFSNAWATWANLEQLSAWHNVPLATKANGLDGFDTELKFNGKLQIDHLQHLVDLQKDKTYDYSGRTNQGEGRFTSGECPLFLTSSAFYGNVKANAKFAFAAAPMPYYPEYADAPQNSIIGGASLWVMGGKTPEEYKGVAKFFTFLSDTDRQAKLHQESGYLPITKAAYEKTKASGFYEKFPDRETPLKELTNKPPTENSRGLRLGNMVQLRDLWCEEIEAALAGQKTAQEALDSAVSRGNEMLRQFEQTIQ